jgi:hypothetical protein
LSNANKNVSQSINNLESKNNPKLQINQRPFVKQALRTKIQRLYPCDKKSKEKLAKLQRKTFNF